MKERPILFSSAMVRALLDGHKTQTRRIIKPQPQPNGGKGFHPVTPYARPDGGFTWCLEATGHGVSEPIYCPYGKPGDRLWVRETFAYMYSPETGEPIDCKYKADPWPFLNVSIRWSPSIHMPRWASRIELLITGVRVERLKDISASDCMAEGLKTIPYKGESYGFDGGNETGYGSPTGAFRALWESINGDGSFDVNPWVWVIEFERVQK